jgi:predicted acetyltransferase
MWGAVFSDEHRRIFILKRRTAMTVRTLTPGDLDAHCRVSSSAFIWEYKPGEESFPKDDFLLGCFDDETGELMADMEVNVRKAVWGGGTVPCVCIGGVASLPHRRREGAVRRLFERLEAIAEKEGWAFGALYPFSDAYYRQFGYERYFNSVQLTVPMAVVDSHASGAAKEELGRMALYEGNDDRKAAGLMRVYNAYARERSCMLLREEANLGQFHHKPYEKCEYTYLWQNAAGECQGYIMYRVDRDKGCVSVDEIVHLSDAALRGLLTFLRVYSSKAGSVVFRQLPPDSPIPQALGEYSAMSAQLRFGPALRAYGGRVSLLSMPKTPAPQLWDGF